MAREINENHLDRIRERAGLVTEPTTQLLASARTMTLISDNQDAKISASDLASIMELFVCLHNPT